MPSAVTVPTAPALSRIPNVELIHTGTWSISTGVWTVTTADISNAIAAMDCPAIRRPILKLGHTDPRFDGEPAVGYISNIAASEGGHTLVGDYEGMPGWLGPVLKSAYPDRSVEGQYDFKCSLGHTHPFVLTAVALLGVTEPGIGTLDSLQDVAALYGVAAGADPTHSSFTVRASIPGGTMPNPNPPTVAAAVTSEDVRLAFYEDAPLSYWICEIQLDPLQVIVCNDEDGEKSRMPVTIAPGGDGSDAVTFGPPVPVVVRYVDVPNEDADEGGLEQLAASRRVVFASRAESRSVAATQEPPAEPVEGNTQTPTLEVPVADTTSTLSEGLRQRLGIKPDAELDEAALLAAVDEALTERAEPTTPPAPTAPEGYKLVSEDVLEELKVAASAGASARAQQLREERDSTLAAAVRVGKFGVARLPLWAKKWDKDPEGTKADLAELPDGLVPVAASGLPGGESATDDDDENYYRLYPERRPQEAKV